MTTHVPPTKLQVHTDLQDARPLGVHRFKAVKNNRIDKSELDEDELDFYRKIESLAGNIERNNQFNAIDVRSIPDGVEVVSGYCRYLAAVYRGEEVKVEYCKADDEEVLDMIYSENEQRNGLNPKDRAVVLAKKLGRYNKYTDELLPPEKGNGLTIADLADKYDVNRGVIHHHLSPLRQSQEVREEFGDVLSESDLKLIEKIADSDAEQYLIAQARVNSDEVDTFVDFKDIYQELNNEVSQADIVDAVCSELTEYEPAESVKGEVDNKKFMSPRERVEQRHEKRLNGEEPEEEEQEEVDDEPWQPGQDPVTPQQQQRTDEEDEPEEESADEEDGPEEENVSVNESNESDEPDESDIESDDVEESDESKEENTPSIEDVERNIDTADEPFTSSPDTTTESDRATASVAASTDTTDDGVIPDMIVAEITDTDILREIEQDAEERGIDREKVVQRILDIYYRRQGRLAGDSASAAYSLE